jgi:hypothetical protein
MLPNFLCIGAQKSGTTSLWRILDAHPDVCMARPRETRFFSDDLFFAEGAVAYERTCFSGWRGQRAVGEKCPEYLFEPKAPVRIRQTLGADVRLIVSLRSPAQRAFSHFRHNRARLRESRSFDEAIAANAAARAAGIDLRAAFAYLERGEYAPQLGRYLELFGADRLLIVHFESEIEAGQQQLAARLYSFLGLSPFTPPGLPFREGRPRFDHVSMRLDTSALDPAEHFVEIRRPRPASGKLLGRFGSIARERVYGPSAALRESAAAFPRNAPAQDRLSRAEEGALNRRYFATDIEALQRLVPFDTSSWLDAPLPKAATC